MYGYVACVQECCGSWRKLVLPKHVRQRALLLLLLFIPCTWRLFAYNKNHIIMHEIYNIKISSAFWTFTNLTLYILHTANYIYSICYQLVAQCFWLIISPTCFSPSSWTSSGRCTNIRAPWRWPRTEAETCRRYNQSINKNILRQFCTTYYIFCASWI
jgi:hypothetical protein